MFSECQHKRVSINYDRVKEGRNHKNENITVDAKSICHGALLKYVLNRIQYLLLNSGGSWLTISTRVIKKNVTNFLYSRNGFKIIQK